MRADSKAATSRLGIPGPYRGRVVAVRHPGSIVSGVFQADPIRAMMHKGMTALTGSKDWAEAWRVLVEPGDVVGIKVNPVGAPPVISCAEVIHQIVDGLKAAGLKPKDVVVYDRYRREFHEAGFPKMLPDGVRHSAAVDHFEFNAISSPQTAGAPVTVTIRATDGSENTVPGYASDPCPHP